MKKAQLGNIFSLPYAAIFLFLILVIYFYVTIFGSQTLLNRPEKASQISFPDSKSDLLLQIIKLKYENSETMQMVYDAYATIEANRIEILEEALKPLVTQENNCLGLAKSESPNPGGQTGNEEYDDIFLQLTSTGELKINRVGTTYQRFMELRRKDQLNSISFQNKDGKNIYIEYFWGKC